MNTQIHWWQTYSCSAYDWNKSFRKKELPTAMCGIIANPRGSTICFLGLTSYRRPLNQRASPTGEIIWFWKRGYWQSCWLSLQSLEATQPISWGPKSLGPPWTQRASPTEDISLLEKGVPHRHVGCHFKSQRIKNLFPWVPCLIDTHWTSRAPPTLEVSPLEKRLTHSHVGCHCKAKRLSNLFLGSHILRTPT